MSIDFNILRGELTNDPLARGYAGMDDQQVADSLNTENRQVNKPFMSGDDLGAAIDETEFNALTTDKQNLVLQLWLQRNLDPFGFAETVIKSIFPVPGVTVSNLAAARVATVSRATELELPEMRPGDIATARAA